MGLGSSDREDFTMRTAVVSFGFVMFVLACWVSIIGHQLGISSFDPVRYEILRGLLPLAYTVAAISLGVLGVIITGMVINK